MVDKKYTYRVKPGYTHGAYNQHGPGALVELTEDEAGGFLDKLELVKDVKLEDPVSSEDQAAHLATLTVPQLKQLPEYEQLENPKPTTKDKIVAAILGLRGVEVA